MSLVEKGTFGLFETEKFCQDAIQKSLLRDTARSTWDLFFRLIYSLEYLQAVSPTAGTILLDINGLLSRTHKCMRSLNPQWREILLYSVKIQQEEMITDISPKQECVLCQYNVPGNLCLWLRKKHTKSVYRPHPPRARWSTN